MKYRVAWTKHQYEEETIDGESFKDAEDWFDESGIDGELFFIEDENGKQIVYDVV